jgi:hypothetical protein
VEFEQVGVVVRSSYLRVFDNFRTAWEIDVTCGG